MNRKSAIISTVVISIAMGEVAHAQLIDGNQSNAVTTGGIPRSLVQQIGAGRGDLVTPNSSILLINRDPGRAIRRGRQLFQRKFSMAQGLGPRVNDGDGDVTQVGALGAGLGDSCALCHARPRGSAGFGGAVATMPDSRDAPHLFGLGLQEMLGDEITADLRAIRDAAIAQAATDGAPVTMALTSERGGTINYGMITANADGTVDTSAVQGVNADLRVRPFFADGVLFNIREFVVGPMQNELGMQVFDPDLSAVAAGTITTTPSGMVLDPTTDSILPPIVPDETTDADGDGVAGELDAAVVDYLEFYLLNYFKAGQGEITREATLGRVLFNRIGCTTCHIPDLTINSDRRRADLETNFDDVRGNPINRLFAEATTMFTTNDDGLFSVPLVVPNLANFVVRNFFADLKRHDLGPNFHERQYNGTLVTQFLTEPLWGVGSTAPYGHDGRSPDLQDVILRHGGEALAQRDAYALLSPVAQGWIQDFLRTLVLFGPDDTASSLQMQNPAIAPEATTLGDGTTPVMRQYPQIGHGAIALAPLFMGDTDGDGLVDTTGDAIMGE